MYEDLINTMLPTISQDGISAPDFQTILEQWKIIFRDIYGDDIYIEPDSKDGVLLSLISYALHGCNNATIAAYNSFSPHSGMGEGLSRNVKINGITRKLAGNSTADVVLTGKVGTVIKNGQVRDAAGNIWLLPAQVTLDLHGKATATAICQTPGAISALSGDISEIATPTLGWQSAINQTAATEGRATETDAELRQRQARSVALPSKTVLEGLEGALANLPGVGRLRVFDNDTDTSDDNGIPAHNIAVVIEGGDAGSIAKAIALKKTPGVPTYGTTTENVIDSYGNAKPIHYFRPADIPIYVEIRLKPLLGYTTDIGNGIKESISEFINSLNIGDTLFLSRLFVPATLSAASGGNTYDILSIEIGRTENSLSTANLPVAFNELATNVIANINIITVSV
ncbi:baseplate J/gp47 family protein [Dryocola sp. BD586]|uniref:baseplate J/gp47 family protein n=1 Tax=Dryocola sp. BD586 TaxID=3133271 RepID=UPI003F5023E4